MGFILANFNFYKFWEWIICLSILRKHNFLFFFLIISLTKLRWELQWVILNWFGYLIAILLRLNFYLNFWSIFDLVVLEQNHSLISKEQATEVDFLSIFWKKRLSFLGNVDSLLLLLNQFHDVIGNIWLLWHRTFASWSHDHCILVFKPNSLWFLYDFPYKIDHSHRGFFLWELISLLDRNFIKMQFLRELICAALCLTFEIVVFTKNFFKLFVFENYLKRTKNITEGWRAILKASLESVKESLWALWCQSRVMMVVLS